jgi:hypothetical protein
MSVPSLLRLDLSATLAAPHDRFNRWHSEQEVIPGRSSYLEQNGVIRYCFNSLIRIWRVLGSHEERTADGRTSEIPFL